MTVLRGGLIYSAGLLDECSEVSLSTVIMMVGGSCRFAKGLVGIGGVGFIVAHCSHDSKRGRFAAEPAAHTKVPESAVIKASPL